MNDEFDEFDALIPFRHLYKYTHLEQYEEHEFMEIFAIELVLRYVNFHYFIAQENNYEGIESATDEDSDKCYEQQLNLFKEIDENFIKLFGLTTSELGSLFLTHPYYEALDDVKVRMYCSNQPLVLNINLDLNQSLEELILITQKHKKEFDDNNSKTINLLQKITETYASKIKNSFLNFHRDFTVRKKAIADALFVFDYVLARQLEIEKLNKEVEIEYNDFEIVINKEFNQKIINEETKRVALINAKNKRNESYSRKPSLNTSSNNCYFKEDLFKKSKIHAGNAKKYYYLIHRLITSTLN